MLLNEAAPALGLFASPSASFPIKNIEGRNGNGNGFVVRAANHTNGKPLTGVVSEPFEEVKKELMLVPSVSQASLARHKYSDDCEAAINEQIKTYYTKSTGEAVRYDSSGWQAQIKIHWFSSNDLAKQHLIKVPNT